MDTKNLLNLKEKLHVNFLTLDHMGKNRNLPRMFQTAVLGSFSPAKGIRDTGISNLDLQISNQSSK